MSGEPPAPIQRLDRWLWFARLLKSRTLAAQAIEGGKVRVNRVRVIKASHTVRAGDVLTVALRGRVVVMKVLAAGTRRGPPPEARRLYEYVDARAGQSTEGHVGSRRDVALLGRAAGPQSTGHR